MKFQLHAHFAVWRGNRVGLQTNPETIKILEGYWKDTVERMKKAAFMAVALALVLLCAGIVIGYFVVPYLMPKERIQENLHEKNIPFHESEWHEGILVVAESVQQFPDFQQFVYAYEGKFDPLYNPYGSPEVYIDTHWKVVWIEVKNTEEMLVYMGFYFY